MKRLRGVGFVILIFLFGVAFGVIVATGTVREEMRKTVEAGPDRVVEFVVERLSRELRLDAGQKKIVGHIATDTDESLRRIRKKTQPEVAAALDQAAQRVRSVLEPDQEKKFDSIVADACKRWGMESEAAAAPQSALPAAPPPQTQPTVETHLDPPPGPLPGSAPPAPPSEAPP